MPEIYLDPDTPVHLTNRRLLEVFIDLEDYDEDTAKKITTCLENVPSFHHKDSEEYIFALMPWNEPELFQDVYEKSTEIPEPIKNALRAAHELNRREQPEDPGYLMIILS